MSERTPMPAHLTEGAQEIASIWLDKDRLSIVIPELNWKDPAEWGTVIAEMIGQCVIQYEGVGMSKAEALDRILDMLEEHFYESDSEDDDADEDEGEEDDRDEGVHEG